MSKTTPLRVGSDVLVELLEFVVAMAWVVVVRHMLEAIQSRVAVAANARRGRILESLYVAKELPKYQKKGAEECEGTTLESESLLVRFVPHYVLESEMMLFAPSMKGEDRTQATPASYFVPRARR